MLCLKAKKTQILIAFLVGTKKVQLVTKKSFLWFRGFRTWFLLLTTPYVMFESKKKTQIFIAHQKNKIDQTQKSTAIWQKSSAKV